jgi:hypothetical protein
VLFALGWKASLPSEKEQISPKRINRTPALPHDSFEEAKYLKVNT